VALNHRLAAGVAEVLAPRADLICCRVPLLRAVLRGVDRSSVRSWSALALSAVLAQASVACSGAKPSPVTAGEPAPRASAAPASAATVSSEPTTPQPPAITPPELVALQPNFALSQDFNLEIKFPTLGQRIPSAKASKYKARLQLDGAPRGTEVMLRLDDNQPRQIDPAKPIELSRLLDADQELGPGEHLLFAVALDQAKQPLSPRPEWSRGPVTAVRFGIDTSEVTPSRAPVARVLSPRGTFNGQASAASAQIDLSVSPALGRGEAQRARLRVSGEGVLVERELSALVPFSLKGLRSGDYRVELELLTADGSLISGFGSRDAQTITVNLDAPLPETP